MCHIRLFNISTHQHEIHLRGHVGAVTSLLVSPSERFLFSGSADNSVQIWNLENMLSIHSLSRHEGSVDALTLYGDLLLTGSEDTEIKLFKYFKIETIR
ncbi:pre-mRNA-processing factor 19-like [Tubulanus polymorphus]|uniref:pre-mRNA-processing factor 19-like n=1 Tax=Tubulanus polymorphus TaxID=672921 RepID=UPI003DA48DF0